MVRSALVCVLTAAVAATPMSAAAQVGVVPAQAPTYRFTLVDGRTVDAQLVGADAQYYTIQTSAGTFSLARAQVTAMVMLQQQAPAYPAAPPVAAPPPPATYAGSAFNPVPQGPPIGAVMLPPESPRTHAPGVMSFLLIYGTTALVAAARNDTDADANLGLIPVIGPVLWAGVNDEDDFGEDGWDWLAVVTGLVQGVSLYSAIRGVPEKDLHQSRRRSLFVVSPAATRTFQGLAVGGSF